MLKATNHSFPPRGHLLARIPEPVAAGILLNPAKSFSLSDLMRIYYISDFIGVANSLLIGTRPDSRAPIVSGTGLIGLIGSRVPEGMPAAYRKSR